MNVILSHDHTDFDAVASQLGAWKLHPEWQPVLGRFLNQNVHNFLTLHWDELPFIHDEDLPPGESIERAMLVDTQSMPSLKGIDSGAIREVCVIDHHALRPDTPETWQIRLDETGSCATIFVEAIAELGLPVTWVEATLLLLGIHEDTGSLLYAGSTARDVRAAAWLMEHGARLDTVRTFLDHPLNERQRTLYRKLLEGAECLDVNGFLIVVASAEVERYVKDISSLAHNIRELYDPAALILVVEMSNHVQLVARSTTEEVDVSGLMSEFGGGGHARAAAAFVENTPREEVVSRLKRLLAEHVRPAVRVGDLMSRGRIRSLTTSSRVRDAIEQMQRWGHEGFPVLDDKGQVAGLLTRRDVERAIQHKLDNAPVTEFMHSGAITVTPEDSIAQVRRIMTELNIGQLPVISRNDGELIGIITRTDLLKHAARTQREEHPPEMRALLERALPRSTLALVRRIAQEAHEQGHHPYLVGGLVRDLLLGSPVRDLDIVIEGNAIQVARALARDLGGRVVSHERFGTAKWILQDERYPARDPLLEGESLPHSIDLITARTEFYERPTALPQVEHASIKQDLHRRDFTINTLALSLAPNQEGRLLDFYGGLADLRRGTIRVLHNLSFIEDPTRIVRAIRFEQRFGFQLEPRTRELLLASLDLLEQVSPDRLRHELLLIMREQEPERTLARMDELGILAHLMPDVWWDESDAVRFQRLREAGYTEPMHFITALIWNPDAGHRRIDRIVERLALPREWQARLHTLYEVRHDPLLREEHPPNSTLYRRLKEQDSLALKLLAVLTEDETLRRNLRHFLDDLRGQSLAISGDALRASGLPPGPWYQQILDEVHHAMLDGSAPDEAAQRALLASLVEKYRESVG